MQQGQVATGTGSRSGGRRVTVAVAARPVARSTTRWTFSVSHPSGYGSTSLVQAFRTRGELDVTISLATSGGAVGGPSTTYALRRCILTGFKASAVDAGPQDDLTFDCVGGVRVDARTVLPNGSLSPTRTQVLPGGPHG